MDFKRIRYLIVLLIGIFLSYCGQDTYSTHIEQKALSFFQDSLLHRKDLFFQLDDDSSFRIPNLDEELYEHGLFKGSEILIDTRVRKITKSWLDSLSFILSPEIYGEEEKILHQALTKAQKDKANHASEFEVNPLGFVEENIENLNLYEDKRVLLLEIRHAIQVNEYFYVELDFHQYFDEVTSEFYTLYVTLDEKHKVIGWFFN